MPAVNRVGLRGAWMRTLDGSRETTLKAKYLRAKLGGIVSSHGSFVGGHGASAGASDSCQATPRDFTQAFLQGGSQKSCLLMIPPGLGHRQSQSQA